MLKVVIHLCITRSKVIDGLAGLLKCFTLCCEPYKALSQQLLISAR